MLCVIGLSLPGLSHAEYIGGGCKSLSESSSNASAYRLKWRYGDSLIHADAFGPHFSNKGISEDTLTKMYIAKVWEPDPSLVKNIVLLSAGQYDPLVIGGVDKGVTGQTRYYRCGAAFGPTRCRTIVDNSMARKVMDNFDSSNTALMLIFDAQFNYLSSEATKNKIKEAFKDCIYSLADNPKLLYFAGSSLGARWLCQSARR